MKFTVLPMRGRPPVAQNEAFLERNGWNDYNFVTLFNLTYRDATGRLHVIGGVKIGQFDMDDEDRRPPLDDEFEQLSDDLFSLGQDDSYYEALNDLGDEIRQDILESLRDVALDLELFEAALAERVTTTSLLRGVSPSTVRNQFHRMALGGLRLSPYSFSYHRPNNETVDDLDLAFQVIPESQPPSNVHVIIGRNGVGKSFMLNNLTRSLLFNDTTNGYVSFDAQTASAASSEFANLISVAFSAFDDFEPMSTPRDRQDALLYTYIGLKKVPRSADERRVNTPKSSQALAGEFGLSVRACIQGARLSRWRRALEMLESDPIFADAHVSDLAESDSDDDEFREAARGLFKNLSSGHKIVLLTITRLVESIEERSLVLLDEPESHLHPPLLSAFIRALSDLLINRNGVAIIATHSPVVLQEVPSSCVWKLRRSGDVVLGDRPVLETFGENVGVLTQEVFGLEVTQSGFHKLISDAVNQGDDYEHLLHRFDQKLGGEGRALAQGLLAARRARRRDF